MQDIIKQALILSKFQTGKINVLSSVKPQNYHVVYVLLLCICCTLFLYLNAVLLYVTLICISFYDVTQPDCSPELFPLNCYFSISKLLDCRCSGAQQLWCKLFFFLKSRISLCLNNRRKHSGQENFGLILFCSIKKWKCMWKQHYTFHSFLFSQTAAIFYVA